MYVYPMYARCPWRPEESVGSLDTELCRQENLCGHILQQRILEVASSSLLAPDIQGTRLGTSSCLSCWHVCEVGLSLPDAIRDLGQKV